MTVRSIFFRPFRSLIRQQPWWHHRHAVKITRRLKLIDEELVSPLRIQQESLFS